VDNLYFRVSAALSLISHYIKYSSPLAPKWGSYQSAGQYAC